ncbi:MAG: hypothetical protein ACM3SY_12400 [Candidatus Omnitrophota bacterium]
MDSDISKSFYDLRFHTEIRSPQNSQSHTLFIATQSPRLVDVFEPNVTVVERDEKSHSSVFKKLDEIELKEWLVNYTLSELWEKNAFGGRP